MYQSEMFKKFSDDDAIEAYFDQLYADHQLEKWLDEASEKEIVDHGNWSAGYEGQPKAEPSKNLQELLDYFSN